MPKRREQAGHGCMSSAARQKNPRGGFTFLEVMVAVAIIAIAFVTLIGSQSQSVSVADSSRFNIIAALLAQQKLTQLEMTEFEDLFSEGGDFGDQYPSYRWNAEVNSVYEEDTSIAKADEMLKSIDLTVSRGERQELSYSVRTIVMRRVKQQ